MNWQIEQNSLPSYSFKLAGQVVILESTASQCYRAILHQWLAQVQRHGATAWLVSCDRHEEGPWAGVNTLLRFLLPEIEANAPDLLMQYDFEWASILPTLRRTLPVRHLSLVDAPPPDAPHLTFFTPDQILRIAQGAINLLSAYHQRLGYPHWVILCSHYDRANSLTRYFFTELMRRRGQQMNLTLLLATDLEGRGAILHQFKAQITWTKLNLPAPVEPAVSKSELHQRAQALALKIADDKIEQEIHLPRLIRYWQLSDCPEQALEYQVEACLLYTIRGFYEDAIEYGETALLELEHYPSKSQKRWEVLKSLHDCYLATNQPELAKQRIERAIACANDPKQLFSGYSNLALLYARYHSNRDLGAAETYLQQGLDELVRTNASESEKFYRMLLSDRALALVRYMQGKLTEAIELSFSIYHRTRNRYGSDKYLPHQALVISNISRAYAVLQKYDEAIQCISDAITIDPHLSEYYNYRGNLFTKVGRLEEATRDYLKAIETSPPYPEVWVNLGHCYRQTGQLADAIEAYTTALDLNPNQPSVWVSRAQTFEMVEQLEAALADYNQVLVLEPNQPLVLANRAILHYDADRFPEALADLNQAIALSPENPDLYQNRAIALTALGRIEEAAQDLRTYLTLNPMAEDRLDVESQLSAL